MLEYPLLVQAQGFGVTDYFALALNRSFRRFPVVTWATDRPSGFSDADIAKLEDINPALAAIVDTRAVRRISEQSARHLSRATGRAAGPRRADPAGTRASGCEP